MELKANESDQNTNDSSNYEKKTYQTKKSAKLVSKTLFISKEKEELMCFFISKIIFIVKR